MLAYAKYYKKEITEKTFASVSNEITRSWSHDFWVVNDET